MDGNKKNEIVFAAVRVVLVAIIYFAVTNLSCGNASCKTKVVPSGKLKRK